MMFRKEPNTKKLDVLTKSEFEQFSTFFHENTGIKFESNKRYYVDSRLLGRINACGYGCFKSYLSEVKLDTSRKELQTLINCMTVNETYFYREEYQFKCMVEDVLDEIVDGKCTTSKIRIWSIPSSTGEEPYSIMLYILEHWHRVQDFDIEIISSDINTIALDACKRGIYSKRSIKNIPSKTLKKYFSITSDGMYQLDSNVVSAVTFTRVNLNSIKGNGLYNNFDLIFCRNLLIYFDDKSKLDAGKALFHALRPDGFIFLGHCEAMTQISPHFVARKFQKATAYQRPSN